MAAAVPVGVVHWFRSRGIPVTAAAHAMLKNEGVQCVEHLKLLEPLGSGKPGWDTVVQDLNNIQKRSAAIVIQQLCRNKGRVQRRDGPGELGTVRVHVLSLSLSLSL